jgi:hypothetical protein
VWVYLLHRDAPAILAAAYPHPLLAPRGGVDVHTVALAGDSGLLGLLEGLTDPGLWARCLNTSSTIQVASPRTKACGSNHVGTKTLKCSSWASRRCRAAS